MECGEIRFQVHNDEVFFSVCKTKKKLMELQVVLVIDIVDKEVTNSMEVNIVLIQDKEPN